MTECRSCAMYMTTFWTNMSFSGCDEHLTSQVQVQQTGGVPLKLQLLS